MYLLIGRNLRGYYHRLIRQLMGQRPRLQSDRSWSYPPLVMAMEEASSDEVETYVYQRQKNFVQLIVNIPIMDICLEVERPPGARVSQRSW